MAARDPAMCEKVGLNETGAPLWGLVGRGGSRKGGMEAAPGDGGRRWLLGRRERALADRLGEAVLALERRRTQTSGVAWGLRGRDRS